MNLKLPIFRCCIVRGGKPQSRTLYISARDQVDADQKATHLLGASLRDLEVVRL